MRRIEPYFPMSHGVPRFDDRRIISGIIFVIRNGLRWRDAPAEYPEITVTTSTSSYTTSLDTIKATTFHTVRSGNTVR